MSDATHLAQGDGLQPHSSNPRSALEDAQEALKQAEEKAKAEDGNADATGEVPQGEPDNSPAPEGQDAEGDQDGGQEGDQEKQKLEPLTPPADWSVEDQDTFRELDPDVQRWLTGFSDRVTQPLQDRLSSADAMLKVEQEWNPYLTQRGLGLPQVLPSLLRADMVLRTGSPQQKVDLLNKLIHDYGIPMGDSQPQTALPEGYENDPVAAAMMPQLQKLADTVSGLQAKMDTGFQSIQGSQEAQIQSQISAFKAETDDKGNLTHPYFDQVEPLMSAIASGLPPGQQANLQDLYDQACWASPDVRAKIQGAQKAEEIARNKKVAAEKNRASSSVSSSPGGSRTSIDAPKGNESVFDTARRAAQAHGYEF